MVIKIATWILNLFSNIVLLVISYLILYINAKLWTWNHVRKLITEQEIDLLKIGTNLWKSFKFDDNKCNEVWNQIS